MDIQGNNYLLYLGCCQGGKRPETNQFLPRFELHDRIRIKFRNIDPISIVRIRELAESLIDRANEEQINELIKQDWLG